MAKPETNSQYLAPQTERLKKEIDHIVVLMLENRSFDNLLGWLYDDEAPRDEQKFEGLNWNLWNPLSNVDSDGHPFTEQVGIRKNGEPYKIGKRKMNAKPVDYTLPAPDPEAAADGEAEEESAPAEAGADAGATADTFNGRHGGWSYTIPKYVFDRLDKSLDDLLADESPE